VRAPEWLWQPNTLSVNARAVYANLLVHRNARKGGIAWPSQDVIAEALGLGSATVKRAIAELKKVGLIEVVRQPAARVDRRYNVYLVEAWDECPMGIRVIPTVREIGIRTEADRDQDREKYGSQRPHNPSYRTPSINPAEAIVDDDDSLPEDALLDVLLWHLIEDSHVPEVVTEPVASGGCSGCRCVLYLPTEFDAGVCDRCIEEVVE
jgi:hypothetical protein